MRDFSTMNLNGLFKEYSTIWQEFSETGNLCLVDAINSIAEQIVILTQHYYTCVASKYNQLDRFNMRDFDLELWDVLNSYIEKNILRLPKAIMMLDAGAGSGRDLIHATKCGYNITGIDNSRGFSDIVRTHEKNQLIARDSYHICDMRTLIFPDNSFHVVRYSASLHHLPYTIPTQMVDLAVKEAYRVLKPGGLAYILTPYGEGIDIIDTGEGLGERFYQLYTKQTLTAVLEDNNFKVLIMENRTEYRKRCTLTWILAIAKKNCEQI